MKRKIFMFMVAAAAAALTACVETPDLPVESLGEINVLSSGEIESDIPSESEIETDSREYEAIYEAFVANEETGKFDYLGLGELTFKDFLAARIQEISDDEMNTTELSQREFAYLDCGKDGKLDLVVHQMYSNEYGDRDGEDFFFFNITDGKVNLIYKAEAGARSCLNIGQSGLLTSSGSSGASSAGYSMSCIDGNGEYKLIYMENMDTELNRPLVPYWNIDDTIRPADYPMDNYAEGDSYYECDTYTFENFTGYSAEEYQAYINGAVYVFYNSNGDCIEPDSAYKDFYDEHGIKYCTEEGINEIIENRKSELGIAPEIFDTYDVNFVDDITLASLGM